MLTRGGVPLKVRKIVRWTEEAEIHEGEAKARRDMAAALEGTLRGREVAILGEWRRERRTGGGEG
jgi:hypothetical protein